MTANCTCKTCNGEILARHVSIALRVEVAGLQLIEGIQVRSVDVFSDNCLFEFCDHVCWGKMEPVVIAAFGLKATYPQFQWITSCSKCGAEVNRTKPYTTLNIYDLDESSRPWLTTGTMHDDTEFAVLCSDCHSTEDAVATDAELKRDHVTAL